MHDDGSGPWSTIYRPQSTTIKNYMPAPACDECRQAPRGPLWLHGTSSLCTDCMVLLGYATRAKLEDSIASDLAIDQYKADAARHADDGREPPVFEWEEDL